MRGDEAIIAVAANRLSHHRAACGRLAGSPTNRPKRFDRGGLAYCGVEAFHIQKHLNVGTRADLLFVGRDEPAAKQLRKVLGDDAGNLTLKRGSPAVLLCKGDLIGSHAHDDLRTIYDFRESDRSDHNGGQRVGW